MSNEMFQYYVVDANGTKTLHESPMTEELRAIVKAREEFNKLSPEEGGWCRCGEKAELASYPQYGECTVCSMQKEHVHCQCGGIMQIG